MSRKKLKNASCCFELFLCITSRWQFLVITIRMVANERHIYNLITSCVICDEYFAPLDLKSLIASDSVARRCCILCHIRDTVIYMWDEWAVFVHHLCLAFLVNVIRPEFRHDVRYENARTVCLRNSKQSDMFAFSRSVCSVQLTDGNFVVCATFCSGITWLLFSAVVTHHVRRACLHVCRPVCVELTAEGRPYVLILDLLENDSRHTF